MKTNLPVTQNEVHLGEHEIIVSTTDLKGQITSVNQTFVQISGFAEAELIGQPHNLVRHPDMPAEAFADLWRSLKEGRPWSGFVKNRCKNGDHYWVEANATPIFKDGVVSGYMSVRRRAGRTEIEACEAAYRLFREGRASGLAIRDGAVVKDGFSISNWIKQLTIAARIYMISALLVAGMIIMGLLGIRTTDDGNARLQTVYADRVVPLKQLKEVADAYAVSIVDLSHKARDGAVDFEASLKKVNEAQQVIKTQWTLYVNTELTVEEKALVVQAEALMKAGDVVTAQLKEILTKKDLPALTAFAARDLYPAIDPISDKVSELVALQLREAELNVKKAGEEAAAFKVKLWGLIVVFAAIGMLLSSALMNSIRRPIKQAAEFFRALGEGRTDAKIDQSRRDELSAISDAARAMQVKFGCDLSEARSTADAMTRIKIALDNVSTGVMIADCERNIVYANVAVHQILKAAESDIRAVLTNFDAEKLMGTNIDGFHKNPAHQAGLLANLTKTHVAQLRIGERHMVVTANPVPRLLQGGFTYITSDVNETSR